MARGGKPLHPLTWLCENGALTTGLLTTPGVSGTEITSSTAFDNFANPTVMRIRGNIFVGLARTAVNDTEGLEFAMGLIMWPDIDVPGSILDGTSSQLEWLWLHFGVLAANTITMQCGAGSGGTITCNAYAANEQTYGVERIMVDVKAKRRVQKGYRLLWVVDWSVTSNNPDLQAYTLLRTLVQD